MTAAKALACAHAAGLTLIAEGNRLRWRGPQPPPDLLTDLRAHKAEVLALLSPTCAATAPTLIPATPEQSASETADREAIGAEELLPAPGTAERDRLDRQHATQVTGLLRVSWGKR
jgi:hypothetical protein